MKTKILVFDIETSPNLSYTWGKYKQYVIEFEQEWNMLCFAYKWSGEKKIHSKALPDYKTYKKDRSDDKELVNDLWKLFDEASVIVAHNGDRFDIRRANTKFLQHGLDSPSSFLSIDTLKVARKYFNFNSNRLNDIAKTLGIGEKDDVNFKVWLGCMNGVKKDWKTMIKYNKKDVKLLEEVYLELRKWISNHPNRALIDGKKSACPTCGSESITRQGFKYTRVGKYQQWKCKDCGSWFQSRRAEKVILEVK